MLNRTTVRILRDTARTVQRNSADRDLTAFDAAQVAAVRGLVAQLDDIIGLCGVVLEAAPTLDYFDTAHQVSGSDGHFVPGTTSGNSLELREIGS